MMCDHLYTVPRANVSQIMDVDPNKMNFYNHITISYAYFMYETCIKKFFVVTFNGSFKKEMDKSRDHVFLM